MQREPKTKIWDVLAAKERHKIWLHIASVMMAVVVFCTTYALILPAITMENKAYCGKEEHTHTDSCYTIQAVQKPVLICSPEDDADFILHTHDETCYDDAEQLICTLTERQAHIHDESCYDEDNELICDEPEVKEHTHDEACYAENGTLICGQPQIIAHQHSTECFEETPVTEDVSVLTCTLEEHTHTDQCFEEPESLSFSYSDDSISGIITIPWSEQLPDDLSCTVVLLDEDDEDYESMRYGANQALIKENNMYNADLWIYQLDWQSEGKSYTLPEDIVPTVELVAQDMAEDETFAGVILEVSDGDADVQQDAVSGNSAIIIDSPEELDSVEIEDENSTDATTSMRSATSVVKTYAASATDSLDDGDDEDLGNQTSYEATSVAADYNTVTLTMKAAATFAAAKVQALPTGTAYYKRVDSISDMQNANGSSDSSGIYVIVSADGTLALGNNTVKITNNYGGKTSTYASWNYQQVTISPVRDTDNNEYFVIRADGSYLSPSNNKTLHWNFYDYRNSSQKNEYYWATKPYFLIGNYGTGGYLWMGYDKYELKSAAYRYYWSIGMMFTRKDTEQTWQISAKSDQYPNYSYQETWYLTYDRTTANDPTTGYITQKTQDTHGEYYNQNWYDCDFQEDFIIYKYVGTNLTIYDDEETAAEVKKTTNEENGNTQEATKPDALDTETTTSASKQGEKTSTSVLNGATFTYSSDKSTSSIEEQFLLNGSNLSDYALHTQQAKNDGRIVTDKSVIYRDDDYGAFESYDEDEFSVTLSALGQEWTIQEQTETTTPVDVVFVLDLSLSMTNNSGTARWLSSVNALNTISNEILSRDEDNRVGLVTFSNSAESVLSLDHYDTSQTSDGNLLTYANATQYYTLTTSTRLKNSSGSTITPYSLSSTVTGMWRQTFTQLGLQCAYEMFDDVEDTTVTRTVNGETKEVTRQPVIILLSDGEPTLGSYDYMNPSAGPVYGFGLGNELFGYYTVLSANYFKNMTSIKYNHTAKFFSLGLGMDSTTGWGEFTKAVLDPSEERLDAIKSWSTFASMLLDQEEDIYLSSSRWYNNELRQYTYMNQWGYTNDVISANPYNEYSSYSYADDAFFGEFTEDELTQILESILDRVQQVNNYGFLLAEDTSLDITDQIGDGMAVHDAPVLRYFGEDSGTRESTNYTATSSKTGTDDTGSFTQYIYDYQVTRQTNDVKEGEENTIDLSKIVVKVYDATATRGEIVKLSIPEDAMPTFYPDLHKQFYYEELPLRLIYKVGLSDDTKSTLSKLGAFATQSYYTNAYTASGANVTTATFTPGANNPYYNIDTSTSRSKTANTTGTYSKYFEEYMSDATTGIVTQRLGNNGKLTVARDGVLVVSKEWDGLSTSETDGKYISAWIYREKQYKDGSTDGLEYVETMTLSKSRNWFGTIEPEAGGTDSNGDYVWQYYVTENLAFVYSYGVSYTDAEGNLLDYVIRYNVPNADGTSNSINLMRLYPLDDSVTITNRNKILTINKVWADDTADDKTVQVQIYRAKTPLNGTNVETTYELVATKDVSAGSPLTYTATSYGMDYNLNAFYYDYYIVEVPVTGYAATYTDSDGNPISPVRITVDGETVTVYPAVKNITITNTEKIPQTVVTKTWSDGYDAHDGQGVYVGLFAKVRAEYTETISIEGYGDTYTTVVKEEYLLKQNRYLTSNNDWSVTWKMNDVGTTYYAGGNNVKYTIEGYYVAEYIYTTSGYAPIYYRMDDDEMVRTDSVVTISSYSTVTGDTATVVTDGTASPNIARYYTAQLAQPTELYPADESVIINNVSEDQLTVTKTWSDGLTPEPVTVGIYPVACDSDNDIVRRYSGTQELTDIVAYAGLPEGFRWTVTLSEENNWTYTWTDLPTSVVIQDTDTAEDVTYKFTYCVYEYQNDDDPYLPIYYDGNHKLITDTITDFEGTPINAVYRPDDGIVNIENEIRHSDLTISKQWVGVEEDDRNSVTVNLYSELLDADGKVVETATLYDKVQLSADNGWAVTVRDLPYYKVEGTGSDKKVYTYRYYVGEVQSDAAYTVTYSVNPAIEETPTITTMSDGQSACYVKFDESSANYKPTYTVTVTNAKGVTMPHTGGIGTHWYTLSGSVMLLAACALYILLRHRQRNRGKGGEYLRPNS